ACAYGSSFRSTIVVLTARVWAATASNGPWSKTCQWGLLPYAAPCGLPHSDSSFLPCPAREAASRRSPPPTERTIRAFHQSARRHTGSCSQCECPWDLNKAAAQPSSSPYAQGHEARGCPSASSQPNEENASPIPHLAI